MRPDGSCPACGAVLAAPRLAEPKPVAERPVPKAPWHFKLLLGALVVYLGFRAYEGVEWLVGRI